MIKKILYKVLDIATLGQGVKRHFEGNSIRMPSRYFRYFPEGYEKDNFLFINEHIKPGMTILDIGAHIGLMAVVFGKRAGAGGKVYAFEPTPSTIEVLKNTLQLNKITNVSVEPYALAEKKGKLTFYISDNNVDNSNSLVNNKRADRQERSIEVEVNTVDHFIEERKISRVDFMKVDVEGAELQLLKGAAGTIQKFKPVIILSIHPNSIRNFGDSQEEIWEQVKKFGYRIVVDGKETGKQEFAAKTDLFEAYLT